MPLFRRLFRSLTFRVIAFSSVWAVLALIVIATVISALFRQASERGFESLLSAHLFNLISSVDVSTDGFLAGFPNLSDLRFTEPQSGWYWTVEPVTENLHGELSSPSLTGPVVGVPTSVVPFDDRFQRRYRTVGLNGEELEVIESEFVLDDQNRVARFRMMGNRSELNDEVTAFER
ncbi:MAG: histidine kinase, partial [Rhizobiaceae bacterium]|nr:histidine kinase [Rhizobiaceae bacterium]